MSVLTERARWSALQLARPYLSNGVVDKGKQFLIDTLNPKPGTSLGRLGTRVVTTRYGWRITVDMAYTGHRALYLRGEYEIHISRLLAAVLDRNWSFVDVGANIGFYTLLAAARADRVWAFEPNPGTRRLLTANVELNDFRNVTILPYGLSDEPSQLALHQQGNDLGGASFRRLDGSDCASATTETVRGDAVLPLSGAHRVMIKVDVEGWEYRALRGLEGVLTGSECAIIVEVTDRWLRETGASAAMLFDYLGSLGFHAFEIYTPPTKLRTQTRLRKLAAPLPDFQYDVLFARTPSEEEFYAWAERAR